MKYFLIIFSLLSLYACTEYMEVVRTDTKEVPTPVIQDFEGFYDCNNHSQLELLVDYNDRVSFETTGQSITTVNPKDDTLCTHPVISDRDLVPIDGVLRLNPRNYNYKDEYGMEGDIDGKKVTGNHRTDISVSKTGPDTITLEIEIFKGELGGSLEEVVVHRIIYCER